MSFNQVAAVSSSDKLLVLTSDSQDYQTETLAQISAFILAQVGGSNALVTQYASPNATAFNVAINSVNNTWLLLTPTGGFATGTITLQAAPANQAEVKVSCTQAVTTLTVSGNGKTVNGAPTTLAANSFFVLRYDAINLSWYRVS